MEWMMLGIAVGGTLLGSAITYFAMRCTVKDEAEAMARLAMNKPQEMR